MCFGKCCEKSEIYENFNKEVMYKHDTSKSNYNNSNNKKGIKNVGCATDAHRHNGRSQNMQIKSKDVNSLLWESKIQKMCFQFVCLHTHMLSFMLFCPFVGRPN